MAKVIEVPGYGPVEFPDSMSDAQIEAAIKANMMAAPAVEPEPPPQGDMRRMVGNIPGSAAKFAGSIYDAVTSPVQTAKGALDLGAGALRNLTPDAVREIIDRLDPNPAAGQRASDTASAVGDLYRQRYGSLGAAKETAITDPVGAVADLSTVLGVGGMAAPGRVGSALSVASKYTNPMTPALAAVKGVGAASKPLLGLTTNVGSENIGQAFQAGRAGKTAFLDNLTGKASATEVLDIAKTALQNIGEESSQAYQAGIANTRASKARLPFDKIDATLANTVDSLKPTGKWVIGKDQLPKIRELQNVVREWRIDPSQHNPAGLDALKRRIDTIYPDSPKHTQVQRAVTQVRNAVKDTIVESVPEYAQAMKGYETTKRMVDEIERALSLGDRASSDTAIRKLQSLARNNVATNYGNRLELAKKLEQAGGVDLMPSIAGQAMNSWTSRGLGQLGMMGTVGAGAVMQNPLMAGLLLPQSPKAVGATAYGLGRTIGAANRVGITGDRASTAALLLRAMEQAAKQEQKDW
jgi:hypothetical protein